MESKNENEQYSDDPSNSGSKFKQYLATICVSLGAVCVGSVLAWTSPVLPQLKPISPIINTTLPTSFNSSLFVNQTDATIVAQTTVNATNTSLTLPSDSTSFTLNESEEGLVGAMLAIGALLSALPAGMLADRIGRRKTLLSLVVPFTISWICAIFATNVWWLYLCRLLAGAATSAMCVCAPMYIGEIAQARIRGQLGSCFQMFLCAGILLTYTLGSFLSWTSLSITLIFLPLIFFVAFFFMPETPVYLIKVADRSRANKSLRYLRGQSAKADDVAEELLGIEVAVRKTQGQQGKWGDLWEKRVNRNALIAGLGVMVFQQLSGINAVIFYTASIFEQSGSSIPPSQATIIVGLVQLVAAYVSVMVVDRRGRKFYLTVSALGMLACLLVLGVYFHTQRAGANVQGFGWVPLISLMVYIVVFAFGFGPIPWLLMCELFPGEIKGIASGLAILVNWGFVFVVTFLFPVLNASLGGHITFYIFAIINGVSAMFVRTYIPETRGKSLSEIQEMLSR